MTQQTEAFTPMQWYEFVPIIYPFGYQKGLQKDEEMEESVAWWQLRIISD